MNKREDYTWDKENLVLSEAIESLDGCVYGAKLKPNGKWLPVHLGEGWPEWQEWERKTGEYSDPVEAIEKVPYFWS